MGPTRPRPKEVPAGPSRPRRAELVVRALHLRAAVRREELVVRARRAAGAAELLPQRAHLRYALPHDARRCAQRL